MCRQLLILLLLLTGSLPAVAQSLPRDFASQYLLVARVGDLRAVADSLVRVGEQEGNKDFVRLVQLHRSYYRSYDPLNYGPGKSGGDPERELLASLEAARKRRATGFEALNLLLLSQFYWGRNDFGRAFEYALRARELYGPRDARWFPAKYFALYELASKYYHFEDFKTARSLLQEALTSANPDADVFEAVPRSVALNTLGLCYRNLGQYDSALTYFRHALAAGDPSPDKIYISIIRGNLGITYYHLRRYREAIPLLEEDIRHSLYKNAATVNGVKSMVILAQIHLDEGRLADAGRLITDAYRITREGGLLSDHKLLNTLYPVLARYHDAIGDPAAGGRYWRAALDSRDSFHRQRNALVASGAVLKVRTEQHARERVLLEDQLGMQKLMRNVLIGGILLLSALGIFTIQQQRARHRLRQRAASAELEHARARLEAFTTAVQEKNELIERFQASVGQAVFEAADTPEDAGSYRELRSLTILTDEQWVYFQDLFEKVHAGFLDRLARKIPGLTPADTRYVALSKLNLSNKEIGAMLGINAASVRVTRSRLRKKLGLGEEASLESVIATI
ncbi:transcriptional regulator [Flaviaesturariibacter amylovorans]|uniref:Tetratricopeptide repeat protein n=1 Tax=Flaviaesturariibacter amylovorans TaxID=1084520 RepID=A0ABP8H883_9BACT